MIGASNAKRGARRIFAVLQNHRLNQHIAYTVLDEVRYFFPALKRMLKPGHLSLLKIFDTLFPDPPPDTPAK